MLKYEDLLYQISGSNYMDNIDDDIKRLDLFQSKVQTYDQTNNQNKLLFHRYFFSPKSYQFVSISPMNRCFTYISLYMYYIAHTKHIWFCYNIDYKHYITYKITHYLGV